MPATEAPAVPQMCQLDRRAPGQHSFVNKIEFLCKVCRAVGNVIQVLIIIVVTQSDVLRQREEWRKINIYSPWLWLFSCQLENILFLTSAWHF